MLEVQLLSKFSDHPFIVRYHEAFVKMSSLYVIMDYCEKGDLDRQVSIRLKEGKLWSEEQVMKLFAQVAAAVHHMHRHNVLHRDLKLANILLDGTNRVRVTDFGISKCIGDEGFAKTQIGTPLFMSPESLKGQPYSYPSDVWSLGCVLYNMLALKPPFDAVSMVCLLQAIKKERPHMLPRGVSKSVSDLCMSMLDKAPDRRPTVEHIMQHESVQKALKTLLSQRKN
eukprot:GHVS01081782.1.p1 GENE.GHVS01081782.1~~GHVS01081782.1.p1  ORF type:complete len:226 (+),score=30.34 GHVS01081782.1:158-835(+)